MGNNSYAVFHLPPQWRAQQAALAAAGVATNRSDAGTAPGIVDAAKAPVLASTDEVEY